MAEYQNPNQQGGGKQDSRSLLIFTTVFLAILLGMQMFRPKMPANHTSQKPEAKSGSAPAGANGVGNPNAPVAGNAATVPAMPAMAAAHESTTTVENELY